MKLTELLINQNVIVQLNFGEKKIEFSADVLEKDDASVYITPYLHSGSPLELNITPDKGVICNLYANNTITNQRVSWKNIELTTVVRSKKTVYCVKTRGFNNIANLDDRRFQERVNVQVDALVYNSQSGESIEVIVRDISDVGISFYAPRSYEAESQQIRIAFADNIDDKVFNVKLECAISRMHVDEDEKIIVGCRIISENKDYQIYRFLKYLKNKNNAKEN